MQETTGMIVQGQKQLRTGYTTGSCMAAATCAAVDMLFHPEKEVARVALRTPSGQVADIPIAWAKKTSEYVQCAVVKDGGDDPDVTNGLLMCVKARKTDAQGVQLTCTQGIGRVTKKGLSCAVGEFAINPVPKRMILEQAQALLMQYKPDCGVLLELSVPEGARVAKKTFNERLGILGGISILGTSGIVYPMSEAALVATIRLELDGQKANGAKIALLVPGNYGRDFAKQALGVDIDKAIKISNYLGEALDYATYLGFEGILLIAHAGKLVKVAAGIMQTHSRYADGRADILACHAALCGASQEQTQSVYEGVSIDDMLDRLDAFGIKAQVMQSVQDAIAQKLAHRTSLPVGFVMFTNAHGILCQNEQAAGLLYQVNGGKTSV